MRIVLCFATFAFLAGCATNPLQNARFWKVEKCTGMGTPDVRFTRADSSTLAIVPRASCAALVAAAGKIQGVANYQVNQIWIADTEAPNAFATLDKSQRRLIVVTMGMLKALGSDEAAWAGLLGHEIAHHFRNHREGRAEAQAGARAAGQAAGNVIAQLIPGLGGFVAGNAANFAATNALYGAYTRPQESEADSLGIKWMVAAGYDPRGMERLFNVLGKHSAGLPGFLSTHPGAEDRGQMVRDFITGEKNVETRLSVPGNRPFAPVALISAPSSSPSTEQAASAPTLYAQSQPVPKPSKAIPPGDKSDAQLAVPLSGAASATNSRIVIKTEPLRNNTIDIKINGQKVATMGGNEVYSGVFSPGWILITVQGGEAKINAEANKEYVFEIAFVGSTSGFLLFGLAGSSMSATYTITLKNTSDIEALPSKTVTEPRVPQRQTPDESGQPSQLPSSSVDRGTAGPQNQTTKPQSTGSETARKLRELNELRKEGLISEQEYNEKRKAILSAM